MRTYILSRLIQTIPVVFFVSLLVFGMFHLLPGTFADIILADAGDAYVDRDVLLEQLGLDKPLHVAYGDWMWGLVQGDMGQSLITRYSIGEQLLNRWPVTVELTIWTLLFTIVLGIPIGVLAAFRQDSLLDYLTRGLAILGLSIPSFWLAVIIITLSSIYLGWLPRQDYVSFTEDPIRNTLVMLLPAAIGATSSIASVARMMRGTMLEVIREDYVRTARAKGLNERAVVWRHAGRNALIPVVTVIGLQFLQLMSGTVIIEVIFDLPGIGNFALESLRFRDFLALQNIVFLYAIIVLIGNLLVDILYAYLDPRISYGTGATTR